MDGTTPGRSNLANLPGGSPLNISNLTNKSTLLVELIFSIEITDTISCLARPLT